MEVGGMVVLDTRWSPPAASLIIRRFGVCLALVQRLLVDLLAHGDSWGSFECDII